MGHGSVSFCIHNPRIDAVPLEMVNIPRKIHALSI